MARSRKSAPAKGKATNTGKKKSLTSRPVKKSSRKSNLKHRVRNWLLCLLAAPVVSLVSLYGLVRTEVIDDLPTEVDLISIQNPHASTLYSADGSIVGKYFIENRTLITDKEINGYFKDALIATEDARFYKHHGVDLRSLVRVAVKSILLQQRSSGGGSTLTQQLAKHIFPRRDYLVLSMLINKLREMCIARDIEKLYDKEEILVLYCNTVSFGELAFGLRTGAERFFNKKPEDLLLEEAATLVGMLKAPTYYSPRVHPDRAVIRRNIVLRQMAKYDYIRDEVADELSELPIRLDYQPPARSEQSARYFKRQVSREFDKWSIDHSKADGSKYNLYRDGLRIHTSLDADLQRAAERIMAQVMRQLQTTFLNSWRGGGLYGPDTRIIDDGIRADPLYSALKKAGKSREEILTAFTTPEERTLWTWTGDTKRKATKIDSIKHYLSILHAGIIAVDPGTGLIRTWVGGNDYDTFQWDNIRGARQVGSTFKPIVYLTALQQGVDPCTFYENERKVYARYKDWSPQNADGEYGGTMSLQSALTHSVNTVSVQVLFDAGIDEVIETAHKLGIESKLDPVPSIVLGTSDVSLQEIVQAYSVFANRGILNPLRSITRIEDSQGNVLYEMPGVDEEQTPVVSPEHIDVLNAILLRVTREGTGSRIHNYNIPFDVMGKTGTTQNQSDGFFIGYTDRLLIGAWVGTRDRRIHFPSLGTGSGGRTALPLVGQLFEVAAAKGYRPQKLLVEELIDCPDPIPDEDTLLRRIAQVEQSLDSLNDVTRAMLKDARRRRSDIPRRNKQRRAKADEEIDRIKWQSDVHEAGLKAERARLMDQLRDVRYKRN